MTSEHTLEKFMEELEGKTEREIASQLRAEGYTVEQAAGILIIPVEPSSQVAKSNES